VDESVREVIKDFLTDILEVLRMKKCLVVLTVLGLCATGAFAVAPPDSSVKMEAVNTDIQQSDPPGPPVFFSDACPATDVGMLDSLGTIVSGATCASNNDYENDGPDCNYGSGGKDEIFQFTVDQSGLWQIDTFNICAGWDTSLMVREETGGGCPGDFLVCDGDSGHPFCGAYESALQTYLFEGTTYYLILDGWSPGTCGVADIVCFLVEPLCDEDADCDDGLFCNGAEWCDPAGVCQPGTPPCAYYQACDEDADVCIDPDPCVSWLAGPMSGYFFPYPNHTPGTWLLDDVELERGCTGMPAMLEYYEFLSFGRDFAGTPQGTPYFYDVALWEVEDGTCMPLAQIAGSQCLGVPVGVIMPGGSPPDIIHCAPGPVALPDNSGDFMKCEIDFFMGYVGATPGVGFSIAGGPQIIGGLAADDDFGVSVFFLESFPGAGTFFASWFGDEVNTPADFANGTVCTTEMGICCEGLDTCYPSYETDCPGDWTACVFWDPPACEDPEPDGLYTICGDNCPNVANPGQEDCDGGMMTPEGDACETDPDYGDNDGDGTCNVDDDCPDDGNTDDDSVCPCNGPASWWASFSVPADTDGDGTADCIDDCPLDDNTDDDSICDCGGPDSWWAAFSVPADDDGDGVANCNDQCPGVDDGVFAPDCQTAIPTISEWGLVILALLLLVAGKVYFGRRAATS
jgi:hypothetical protein